MSTKKSRLRFGSLGLFVENTVFGNSLDYLAVDLEGSGSVKFNGYLLARADVDEFFVLDVLALEEGGEDHKRFELAGVVEDAGGNESLAIEAILIGAGHHTAASLEKIDTARHNVAARGHTGCGGGKMIIKNDRPFCKSFEIRALRSAFIIERQKSAVHRVAKNKYSIHK